MDKYCFRCLGAVAASLLLCASAFAQTADSYRFICNTVGSNAPEPLGDREGHAISVSDYACRVEGGALDGGLLTGRTIYEWDKTNAVGLTGSGVTRKPGATTSYENTETKAALTMEGGKPAGVTGSGRGHYTMATGSAAALKGKSYSFTFKSSGPGQFVVDVKLE